MNGAPCSGTAAVCGDDLRRAALQENGRLCGLDYVDVLADGVTLRAHLFGAAPPALEVRQVRIEGGQRITAIEVVSVEASTDSCGGACLLVVLDRRGDFSPYCLCLVDSPDLETRCGHDPLAPAPLARAVPAGVDPRYACAEFSFRLDCPGQLDCLPPPCAEPVRTAAPAIDYLARDFPSIRALLLDRLAGSMPQWRERHVPDLMLTLVELLAFKADQLNYQLDAVATEAYLATARRRISVRRHARLLDYRLHEGCNARAWLALDTDSDVELDLEQLVFACPPPDTAREAGGMVEWSLMQQATGAVLYQPMAVAGTCSRAADSGKLVAPLHAAHSTIHFYTWRYTSCCLPQGSTRATLLDPGAALRLAPGQFLLLEEVGGAATGAAADADRTRRHVVRLTRVEAGADPLDQTALLEVEWDRRDALPFALCLSARSAPPDCSMQVLAVARGNLLLVDHGCSIDQDDGWVVGTESSDACCACDGAAVDVARHAAELRITLARRGITHAAPLPAARAPASMLCAQDPRQALAQVRLEQAPGGAQWHAAPDLLAAAPGERLFVAEIDDDGYAQLRFGPAARPQAGTALRARYRVGNGQGGNVGADAIVWMAYRAGTLGGAAIRPRNPLPACGGTDPEPVADARLFAPHAYGRALERAVRADDYAQIARSDSRIQGANASLAWTGAWYEAVVALDPYGRAESDPELGAEILDRLQSARRIGHDVRIVPARRLPLQIAIDLCVAPGHASADVLGAVIDVLSSRALANGELGMFHPDRLVFGADIAASRVVAAVQRVGGVAHLELTAFATADASPAQAAASLADGVIAIGSDQIAQLDNNPDFPQRGSLKFTVRGGR